MIYHVNHLDQNSSPNPDWSSDNNLVSKENRMHDWYGYTPSFKKLSLDYHNLIKIIIII